MKNLDYTEFENRIVKLLNEQRSIVLATCENGTAVILGHPSTDANKAVLLDCSLLDDRFMHWAKYKNSVLIEVEITNVECWVDNGREYMDVKNKKAYRIG